jgi:O-antigen/teichoic acid export membrane protein
LIGDGQKLKFLTASLGRLSSGIAGFLTTSVIARYLAPEEAGSYYLLVTVVTFFHWFFINPLASYIATRATQMRATGHLKIAISYYGLFLAALIVLFLPLVYALQVFDVISIFPGSAINTALAFGLLFLASSTNLMFAGLLNLLGESWKYIILLNVDAWLRLLLGFVALQQQGLFSRPFLFIITISSVSILVSVGGVLMLWKIAGTAMKVRWSVLSAGVWNYSWPISIATFFQWFQSQGWRVIVERIDSVKSVGLISVAASYSIALVSALQQILDQISLPSFYHKYRSSHDPHQRYIVWRTYAVWMILRVFGGTCVVVVVASLMLAKLANANYTYLIPIAVVFAFIEFLRVVSSVFQQRFFASEQTRGMLYPFAVAACSSALFVTLGIRSFGFYGVAAGLLVSGTLTVSVFYLQAKKAVRKATATSGDSNPGRTKPTWPYS